MDRLEIGSAYLLPLAGGVLLGLAACALLFLSGRVAGLSGILAGLGRPSAGASEWGWRAAFTVGLLVGGGALLALRPSSFAGSPRSLGVLAVAGLLVGFGARLGSGCTSGHGVCGLGRLSGRSAVATVTFMATGAVAAILGARLLGHGGVLAALGGAP
jgi:hypothetical protein